MIITNKSNLPQALYDFMLKNNERHNEPNCYSATTIIKPTRMILLTERHWDEIEVDCSTMINMLFGTATHEIMEKFDKTGNAEMELKQEIRDGLYLTGKCDMYDENEFSVDDWKTATTYKIKKGDFDDWNKQGNIYGWLLNKVGKFVNKSTFYALLKDWTPREKRIADFKKEFYPETQVYEHKFDITTNDLIKTEAFIRDKFNDIYESRKLSDDELAYCGDEETWYTGDKYAVHYLDKNGNPKDKAWRVFDTEEEAKKVFKKGENIVIHRKGEHRRCMDYCECNKFCKR